MRITVTIDDALLQKAQALTGLQETSALVSEGLRALVQRGDAVRAKLAELNLVEQDVADAVAGARAGNDAT